MLCKNGYVCEKEALYVRKGDVCKKNVDADATKVRWAVCRKKVVWLGLDVKSRLIGGDRLACIVRCKRLSCRKGSSLVLEYLTPKIPSVKI